MWMQVHYFRGRAALRSGRKESILLIRLSFYLIHK